MNDQEEYILFNCPHCGLDFIVYKVDMNCRILRHFSLFNFAPLNPHASREECVRAVETNQGYGCAKPIELVFDEVTSKWEARACDYK